MKKLLFIIGLAALLSCEKQPEECWQCKKDIFSDIGYSSKVSIICDKTENEIRDFEQTQSREFESQSTVVVMTCKRYN